MDVQKEPKLEPYWREFVEYRTSPEYLEKSAKASENASKHVHPHHLGTGGYWKRIPEWDKMEADLLAKGVNPVTLYWEDRAKHWMFAREATLDPQTGPSTCVQNQAGCNTRRKNC